jgi:urease accessory protein UreF
MPSGSSRSSITLERLKEVCERFYDRDGFVKWSDVGAALGVSRQAVQLRLRAAVERGDISPETVERWQSMSSRRATTRERREQSQSEDSQLRRSIRFTPENMAWLQEECTFRKLTVPDIINGLVNVARER